MSPSNFSTASRCPSRTPTPVAGSATCKTDSSRFGLLREMLEEDNQWDSDPSSGYSDYDFNNDSDTVASSMLPIFASCGKMKPKRRRGKAKRQRLAPRQLRVRESLQLPYNNNDQYPRRSLPTRINRKRCQLI